MKIKGFHESPWVALARGFAALPPHMELTMPSLSPTMSVGNIANWVKKEGDAVAAGDILADIETDKATLGFDSQEDGFLAKILVAGGSQNVAVGTPIAVLCEEASDVAAFAQYQSPSSPAQAVPANTAPADPSPAQPAAQPAAPAADLHDVKMGPAARHMMAQLGLSPSQVQGTAWQGIITKGDVMAAVASGVKGGAKHVAAPATTSAPASAPSTPAAPAAVASPSSKRRSKEPFTDETNSQIRKIIAGRLLESKTTTPHVYLAVDANLDAVMSLREELKAAGVKVSVNDCVVKAAALALADVPEANAYWNQVSGITNNDVVDVSMAVSTDKGLITPIIKAADKKTLLEISADAKRLAGKARENKLTPDEFQGGTFSISNLGMFPVDQFCAIINPPQAAIMAVGRGVKKVVLRNGKPATTQAMTVTISADHRVYQGGVGAKFLAAFKGYMESPSKMML